MSIFLFLFFELQVWESKIDGEAVAFSDGPLVISFVLHICPAVCLFTKHYTSPHAHANRICPSSIFSSFHYSVQMSQSQDNKRAEFLFHVMLVTTFKRLANLIASQAALPEDASAARAKTSEAERGQRQPVRFIYFDNVPTPHLFHPTPFLKMPITSKLTKRISPSQAGGSWPLKVC